MCRRRQLAERGAGDFGEAEVENFCLAAPVTKMLAGLMSRWTMPLEWAASRASAISMAKFENGVRDRGTAGDGVLERFAFEALHGDEGFAVFLADVVDGADVGVIEGRGGSGFAVEAFECLRILGDGVGKKFEGDEAAEARVFAFIYDAHSAATEFLDRCGNGRWFGRSFGRVRERSHVRRQGLVSQLKLPGVASLSFAGCSFGREV